MKLRDYQGLALDSLYEYFRSNPVGNPVIAMPTGTGKAVVIAGFVEQVLKAWPSQRILMLTHVKELVKQNAEKLKTLWPQAPLGIYSAGLKTKQPHMPVVFAGVQSAANSPELFGKVDIIIVDECHLVGPDDTTAYQKLIAFLKVRNPLLRVIGLSATIYRMGLGMITDNGIFTDVCYDLTSLGAFNRLLDEGYLCPLVPMPTETILDISNVQKQGGEFVAKQLQAAVNKKDVTEAALTEMLQAIRNRKHNLIFTTGVEHVTDVVAWLLSHGESAVGVHSKMSAGERDDNLDAFIRGDVRHCVNMNILTTGFDMPHLDNITNLRPTNSVVLHVQMLGRGTRPLYAPQYDLSIIEGRLEAIAQSGKRNCQVLDFAGNVRRLGPINDPRIPGKKGDGAGDIPVKPCMMCGCLNHISARVCINCGEEFQFEVKITDKASTAALIVRDEPEVVIFNVDNITYAKHISHNSGYPTLKVSYFCGMRRFIEYVCLEHPGNIRHKAHKWWADRSPWPPPPSVADAVQYISGSKDALKEPRQIRVWVNQKNPKVLSHVFE